MHSTPAEVQRIQAKLQMIGRHRRQTHQPPSPPPTLPTQTVLNPAFGGRRDTPNRRQPPQAIASSASFSDRLSVPPPARPRQCPQPSVAASQQPVTARARGANRPSPNHHAVNRHSVSPSISPSSNRPVEPYRATDAAYYRSRSPQTAQTASQASAEEAARLADKLRYRQYHDNPAPSKVTSAGLQTGPDYLLHWGKRLGRSMKYPLLPRPAAGSDAAPQPSATPDRLPAAPAELTLQDAILWIAASAAVRVGLDLLLVTYAGLWLPVVALIVAPAAIVLYRTAVNPEAGFTLGRRLLLIMIGLLLGGRVL